jgi:hypothetical protein
VSLAVHLAHGVEGRRRGIARFGRAAQPPCDDADREDLFRERREGLVVE